MIRDAVISDCGRYRYLLRRGWFRGGGRVCWVMLNPSKADAHVDDPTVRSCIGFSKKWGYKSLAIVNLFAWRATRRHDLELADDPVGPENDRYIRETVENAQLVVVAWGALCTRLIADRAVEVEGLIGKPMYCLRQRLARPSALRPGCEPPVPVAAPAGGPCRRSDGGVMRIALKCSCGSEAVFEDLLDTQSVAVQIQAEKWLKPHSSCIGLATDSDEPCLEDLNVAELRERIKTLEARLELYEVPEDAGA